MGAIVRFADRLVNLMSGAGTTADKRTWGRYQTPWLDQAQIEASYRGSWLMRKAIDLPPYDMTRAGRDWQAKPDQIEKLEAEERRLQLWDKLRRGLVLGRLGGGALILGIKQGSPLDPVDPTRVVLGDVRYAHLTSRYRLGLGAPITDPESPWYGRPSYFQMTPAGGQPVQVHPSRVIAFRGQQVPDMATADWQSVFWGDPVAQSIMDAVQNADMAQGGFATLIDEAKLDIIKMPGLMQNAATAEYEQRFMERLRLANLGKSTHRALVIDADEEWDQRQINWAGMPDVLAAYVQIVAGAADIPATRLLGKSPDGMNATGEGDENNYREMITGRQTNDLKPLIDQIDDLLIPSALGQRDPNISWLFAPLSVMSETEAATVAKTKAETTQIYANSGLVPTIAMEKGVQNQLIEDGIYPGLDGVLDGMSDEERFPSLTAPDPNEPDPSALVATGDPGNGGKEGDPTSPTARGVDPKRRPARAAPAKQK
jgi:phage-related protein (TIGR01555 family)